MHEFKIVVFPNLSSSTSHEVCWCFLGVHVIVFHQFHRRSHPICNQDAIIKGHHIVCVCLVKEERSAPPNFGCGHVSHSHAIIAVCCHQRKCRAGAGGKGRHVVTDREEDGGMTNTTMDGGAVRSRRRPSLRQWLQRGRTTVVVPWPRLGCHR